MMKKNKKKSFFRIDDGVSHYAASLRMSLRMKQSYDEVKFRDSSLPLRMTFPIIMLTVLLFPSFSNAQSTRELINEGVDLYKEGKYTDSEVNFKKGIEKAEENFAANFNLGDAYYKQQRYEEAMKSFNSALQLAESDNQKAKVHHNMGNSLLKAEKIQEAVDEYKKALKLNPDDEDTKYNLSYALNLLKNKDQQKQQNKNDQNKDKNKDQNKDQNQNQDQNKDQDKKDQQNKDQKQDQQKPDQNQTAQNDNTKQQQNKISKEEAERILEALKNNEKDLQKKLRKKTGTVVKTDKDW